MQQSVELLWVYNNLIGNRIWIINSMGLGFFTALCVYALHYINFLWGIL